MTSTPIIIDCEQGSDQWAAERCGLVTASRCGDVIAVTRKGEGAARRDYRTELIAEILTGQPYPHYVTREMQWGRDQEPHARTAYELQHDVLVETCGFLRHGHIARFGASPDGLIGDDGILQIKCPTTTNHLAWMLAGTAPIEYMPQMLAELSVSGRAWCDFVSFDPRLPSHLQLFVCRLQRRDNEKLIASLETEVIHFTAEIDQVLGTLPQRQLPAAKILQIQ